MDRKSKVRYNLERAKIHSEQAMNNRVDKPTPVQRRLHKVHEQKAEYYVKKALESGEGNVVYIEYKWGDKRYKKYFTNITLTEAKVLLDVTAKMKLVDLEILESWEIDTQAKEVASII